MSRGERKSACPPSCQAPTSKETRVRVEDFMKIIASDFPARGFFAYLPMRMRSARAKSLCELGAGEVGDREEVAVGGGGGARRAERGGTSCESAWRRKLAGAGSQMPARGYRGDASGVRERGTELPVAVAGPACGVRMRLIRWGVVAVAFVATAGRVRAQGDEGMRFDVGRGGGAGERTDAARIGSGRADDVGVRPVPSAVHARLLPEFGRGRARRLRRVVFRSVRPIGDRPTPERIRRAAVRSHGRRDAGVSSRQ